MEERSFSSLVCVAGAPVVDGNRFRGLVALLLENIVSDALCCRYNCYNFSKKNGAYDSRKSELTNVLHLFSFWLRPDAETKK